MVSTTFTRLLWSEATVSRLSRKSRRVSSEATIENNSSN